MWCVVLPLIFLTGAIRADCNLSIPLGPDNWTVVQSGPIPFFCNRSSSSSDCPLQPPGAAKEWLQLGSPNATKLEIVYEFPEECFPWAAYNLTFVNMKSVTDPACAYAQKSTMLIEMGNGVDFWPLLSGFNWTHATYSSTPYTPVSGDSFPSLKLLLHVKDDAFREFSYIVIGEINLKLWE